MSNSNSEVDITGLFNLKKYTSNEFMIIAQTTFHRGSGIGTRTVRLEDDSFAGFIELHYSKKGEMLSVSASDTLDKKVIDQLVANIKGLDIVLPERIAQAVIFSSLVTVDGNYKYKDEFQILPIKKSAPHLNQIWGMHPFIIQYKFIPAKNVVISNFRSTEKLVFYSRLLNLFSYWRIYWGNRNAELYWVLTQSADSAEYRTLGYTYPKIRIKATKFYKPKSNIRLEKAIQYYDFRNASRSLTLPEDIDQFMDKAISLQGEEKEKFLKAITWFDLTSNIDLKSSSVAYIALISSIECLLDDTSTRCECCGQLQYKISAKFKHFLKQYSFGNSFDEKTVNKLIDTYYTLRSNISHGGVLMRSDVNPWLFMDNKSFEEQEIHRSLYPNVRIAIINWLMSR